MGASDKIAENIQFTLRFPFAVVEDALAGYLAEVADVREMLDGRYDQIKSGQVKPIDGEGFFENLRQRENELLAKQDRRERDRSWKPTR